MVCRAIKTAEEVVPVVYNGNEITSFEVYKLVGDDTAEDITPELDIVTIADNHYTQEVTMPNEACIVVVIINKAQYAVLLVNTPVPTVVYVRYGYEDDVPITRFNLDGDVLDDEVMSYRGNGIHTFVPSTNELSVVNVDGNRSGLSAIPYPKTMNGSVLLQRGVWQMVAVPVTDVNVAEYFCDALAEQEGVEASDLIEVVNTYRGSDNKFKSYIPGTTLKSSVNNFSLIYDDNGYMEISAMWVKTTAWEHTDEDILFNWEDK